MTSTEQSAAKRGRGRRATAVLALAAGVFVFAATAGSAAPGPITSGKSVLKPDPATLEGFADMSIGVEPTGAAESRRNGYVFPVRSGEFGDDLRGAVVHRGGLGFFMEGGPGVKFSKFFIRFGAQKAKLFARSGGAEVRFIDLDLDDATIVNPANRQEVKIKDAEALLGKEGAEVLSETFDFPFRKGIPFGFMTIKVKTG